MVHVSPASILLWSCLASLELIFLVVHLYRYDKFACLKWSSGRQPGAFKRVMTYSYLLCVPMILVFAVMLTIIKYDQGYMVVRGVVMPKPYQLWPAYYVSWILPIYIIFSVAWSLEIVSHLEELTFWLFLLNQGPAKRGWFSSTEFRSWIVGSAIAVIGMPLVTVFTRDDPMKMEAWTFLAGSCCSLILTLWFIVVLVKFPNFLKRVRAEGAEAEVVVRLTTFDEFNRIRVAFRFMFVLPLLLLAVDGVFPEPYLNLKPLCVDIMTMLAGIGCIVSSVITLLIFFPRSIAKEAGYKAKTISIHSKTRSGGRSHQLQSPTSSSAYGDQMAYQAQNPSAYQPPPHQPTPGQAHPYGHDGGYASQSNVYGSSTAHGGNPYATADYADDYKVSRAPDWEMQEMPSGTVGPYRSHKETLVKVRNNNTPRRPQRSAGERPLHPLILNYTSPIDLLDMPDFYEDRVGRAV